MDFERHTGHKLPVCFIKTACRAVKQLRKPPPAMNHASLSDSLTVRLHRKVLQRRFSVVCLVYVTQNRCAPVLINPAVDTGRVKARVVLAVQVHKRNSKCIFMLQVYFLNYSDCVVGSECCQNVDGLHSILRLNASCVDTNAVLQLLL